MATAPAFEFDVAISLLAEDESYARQIEEEITKVVRGEVFLYSRRQQELAASGDLVDRFTRVFRDESRVVVILYRPGWGGTPFTSIEHDAIRGRRARSSDIRWLVVVSMEPPAVPDWFPASDFWMSRETFTAEGIAAVVAARSSEAGGAVGRESPAAMARRLSGEQASRGRRDRRMQMEGRERTEIEIRKLQDELMRHAEEVSEAWQPMVVEQEGPLAFSVRFRDHRIQFLHRAGMGSKPPELSVRLIQHRRGGTVTTWTYQLELDEQEVWCWRMVDIHEPPSSGLLILRTLPDELETTAELAESYARRLVKEAST